MFLVTEDKSWPRAYPVKYGILSRFTLRVVRTIDLVLSCLSCLDMNVYNRNHLKYNSSLDLPTYALILGSKTLWKLSIIPTPWGPHIITYVFETYFSAFLLPTLWITPTTQKPPKTIPLDPMASYLLLGTSLGKSHFCGTILTYVSNINLILTEFNHPYYEPYHLCDRA